MIRRKRSVLVSTAEADVAVHFTRHLELCGGVVSLARETHRPIAISLNGGLRRVLLSLFLRITGQARFSTGLLVSAALDL